MRLTNPNSIGILSTGYPKYSNMISIHCQIRLLLVPEREVESVDMSVEEAMKLIVSGGLYSSGKTMGVPTFDPKDGAQFSEQHVEVKTG